MAAKKASKKLVKKAATKKVTAAKAPMTKSAMLDQIAQKHGLACETFAAMQVPAGLLKIRWPCA